VPLGVELTGGNRNDVTQLLPLVDGIGAIAGKRGRPRQRPDQVIADRGCDHDKYRHELWRRGVKPVIAPRMRTHAGDARSGERGSLSLLPFHRCRSELASDRAPADAFTSSGAILRVASAGATALRPEPWRACSGPRSP
jgi:Transposase DDE domain